MIRDLRAKVLLIDDDPDASSALLRALRAAGVAADLHSTAIPEAGLNLCLTLRPHLVILDLSLDPQRGVESGYELLQQIIRTPLPPRVLVLTGHSDTSYGIRAMNLGAANFVAKPADPAYLAVLVTDGIAQAELRRERDRLQSAADAGDAVKFIGTSAAARRVRKEIAFAAATRCAVLITGETGSGKGLCASEIHRLSAQSGGRLVRYQPTGLSAELTASDLFGHTRGAFTGAGEGRAGLILAADGGTLFLDEIDALPLQSQISLLGVLNDQSLRPVGSDRELRSNFRLISATNGNLESLAAQGSFRADLLHRIAHLRIQIDPLRSRREDIPLLLQFAINVVCEREHLNISGCSEASLAQCLAYDWPGNVRELEARAAIACARAAFRGDSRIEPADLALTSEQGAAVRPSFQHQVESYKRGLIAAALERCRGNQVRAARELNLDRSTMRRILLRSACPP